MRYWLEVSIDPEDGTCCDYFDLEIYEDASPEVLHAIARDLARINEYESDSRLRWEYYGGYELLHSIGWTEQ